MERSISDYKKLCACGCNNEIPAFDKRGKPRTFVMGHHTLGKRPANYKGKPLSHGPYLLVLSKGHPRANQYGYVREHMLVYEKYYQCCMLKWGIVHHINDVKNDNRIENLQGMTRGQHMSLHKPRPLHSFSPMDWWKGKHLSDDHKRKIGESLKGRATWNKGKPRSEQTKLKISETLRRMRIKKHSNS